MITQTLPVIDNPILAHNLVRAACHLISASGLVIPKNTVGRVLEYTPAGSVFIDFGALPVFLVPVDSPLIEWRASR